jgi:hypothetical protein
MNYLCSGGLNDAAHDVDGGIMAVKQTCGGYNPDFMDRPVGFGLLKMAVGCRGFCFGSWIRHFELTEGRN